MRIAIAGIGHEALTFSPLMTRMKDLQVMRGQDILDFPGVTDLLQTLKTADLMPAGDIEPVPILVAHSLAPSGVIEEATYLALREELLQGFRDAGHLDGICLVLHGAMLVENIWSGETDLVRCIRAIVGNEIPIAARLDLHANLTDEFASKTDIWAGFRTAPHRDVQETLERALSLLVHTIRSGLRPKPVFIRVPLLLQGEKATTAVEPMKSLLAIAQEIEDQPGILNAEVLVGFGWADAPHAAANIAVIAESEEHLPAARDHARRLAQAMWDRREEFTFDQEVAPSIDEAIDRARAAPESTVFLTDSGDNPTAGATGDTTGFLSRLLNRQVPDAIFASIPDEAAAQTCFQAGTGATVSLSLGGKMDTLHGDPVQVTGSVEHLYHPAKGVTEAAMATVQVDGVHIIVTDIRKAFTTLDDFRKAGIEPLQHKIVVVKLGYLMPELRDAAPREILALSPGYADMDLTRLPYKYVTRPIFPLDTDFEWHPVITNVAGYGK
jgi:microcystin degradation protein MlrC